MRITEEQYNKLNSLFNTINKAIDWHNNCHGNIYRQFTIHNTKVFCKLSRSGQTKTIYVDKVDSTGSAINIFYLWFAELIYLGCYSMELKSGLTVEEILKLLQDIIEACNKEQENEQQDAQIKLQKEKQFLEEL